MEIHELLRVLTRRWWIVSATVVAGLLIAGIASAVAVPTFVASTRVYLTTRSSGSVYSLFISSLYAKHEIGTYADVARSSVVLRPVIDDLSLPYSVSELADRVTVSSSAIQPELITISVTDSQGPRSAAIANGVAQQLGVVTAQLSPASASTTIVTITQTQPAVPEARPEFPRTPIDLGVGLIGGLLAGLVIGTAVERLDTRIRRPEDVDGVPVLAAISREPADRIPLVVADEPSLERTEAFRRLALVLAPPGGDDAPRVLVVTSVEAGDGRAGITADLALSAADAMSDARGPVLVVGADLRRSEIDALVGAADAPGLSELLAGTAELDDVVRPWWHGRLDVLPTGALPPNPLRLLQSARMRSLLDELRTRYSLVVFDAAVSAVSDAALLGSAADGTIVVVEAGRSTTGRLGAALRRVVEAGGRPVGVVLDRVGPRDAGVAPGSSAPSFRLQLTNGADR